jgi:hypothetical protein
MRKAFLMICLIFLTAFSRAQTTETLQGSVVYSDNSGFNGSLLLTLSRPTVVNICTLPVQVINSPTSSIPIVNGVATPTAVLSTDCLQPKLPYAITLRDARGSPIYSDNWYVPALSSGVFDIGSLIQTNYAAGVTVSLPSAIVGTPAGNQTITQPGGTVLSVNLFQVSTAFSGTKTAGSCVLTIAGGIITNVTGC